MSEPIKPRIDFEQSIKEPEQPVLRAGQAFDGVLATPNWRRLTRTVIWACCARGLTITASQW